MFYFIPSWYDNDSWKIEAPYWFRVFEKMRFDDSINQMKIFQNSNEDAAFILNCYQPQLRYFLHKQDLLKVSYWSFFDDIQNIHRTETKAIQFQKLGWPKGISFTYTPFMVVARMKEKPYANIHFAENGNLLQIIFIEDGKESRVFYFDDRGFLSSIKYLEDGQLLYQDYLNELGVWQVREYFSRQDIFLEINPNADKFFQKAFYDSWEELFVERLRVFEAHHMNLEDCLVVSADERHNDLILRNFPAYRKVFSIFGERFRFSNAEELKKMVDTASLIIVDTEITEHVLLKQMSEQDLPQKSVSRVTPFDTRLRLGQSQTIQELIVYFLIDGISKEKYNETLHDLLELMVANPLIELHLITYESGQSKESILSDITDYIMKTGLPMSRFTSEVDNPGENNLDEDREMGLTAVQFHTFTNENQIIKELDTTRLVIDLSPEPDLYTQIASLSAGIPQINSVQTDYVSHGENGWIAPNREEVVKAVSYYFDGLSNWNRSLVYTVQKMGEFTSGKIIEHWKELLVKSDENPTSR
ncbi:TPA: accessory Sec system protein Asp1 [Streptococcus suis]